MVAVTICSMCNAPVICIPDTPPRAGDNGDTHGQKCWDLTSDLTSAPTVQRMCRDFNFPPIHGHINSN